MMALGVMRLRVHHPQDGGAEARSGAGVDILDGVPMGGPPGLRGAPAGPASADSAP